MSNKEIKISNKKKSKFSKHITGGIISKFNLPSNVLTASPDTKKTMFFLQKKSPSKKVKSNSLFSSKIIKIIYEFTPSSDRSTLYAVNIEFNNFLINHFPLENKKTIVKLFKTKKKLKKYYKSINFWIKRGNIPISTSNYYPLRKLIKYNFIDLTTFIFKNNLISNETEEILKISLLSMAASRGYEILVMILLNDKRIDPIKNSNESLVKAAGNGHYDTCILLLMDRRIRTYFESDKTPLNEAKKNGHKNVVRLLKSFTKRKNIFGKQKKRSNVGVLDFKGALRDLVYDNEEEVFEISNKHNEKVTLRNEYDRVGKKFRIKK